MISLYLFRHAECEKNTDRTIVGGRASSSPLTPKGLRQALAMKNLILPYIPFFDQTYSSTALRAIQTADIISPLWIQGGNTFEALEELDQGDFEDKPRSEVYTPEVMTQIKANSLDFKAPNGESQREVGNRINTWMNRIVTIQAPFYDHEDRILKVAVFSHGLAIKCWLQKIMQFDKSVLYPMTIDQASLTRLDYIDDAWRIKCINFSLEAIGTIC